MWCSSSVAQHLPQAIARLRARYDFEGDIVVSDMSLRDGGPFAPHKSHQNGRDVDIWLPMLKGVYEPEYLELDRQPYSDETDWFALYGLLVELQETGAVEAVFLQWKLQEKVYAAAKLMGASDQELASMITWPRPALSQTGPQQALLQHSDAYISQIHVRFACAANDIDCSAR